MGFAAHGAVRCAGLSEVGSVSATAILDGGRPAAPSPPAVVRLAIPGLAASAGRGASSLAAATALAAGSAATALAAVGSGMGSPIGAAFSVTTSAGAAAVGGACLAP
jgi:hypothetical protein